jgi:peroxiredoxin
MTMKLVRIAFFLAAIAGVATATRVAGAEPGTPLAIGGKAPMATTKMKNVDGKMVSIADSAGKAGTLVIFTCNHCPFAKAWEERIVELGNGYAKKGVGVILINANDPAKYEEDGFAEMQTRAKSRGLQVPYVVDETSAVAREFGASVTPEAFLFDKAGKLVYHGAIDDNHKQPDKVQKRYLKDALDAVIAGKPPGVPESKSIGCGIKFRKA